MEEKKQVKENQKQNSVFLLIYKNLLVIILVTVLFALCGLALGFYKVKPVYTASRTVILRASVDNVTASSSDAKNKNDVSLAKRLLPNVAKDLTNEVVERFANETYTGEGTISRRSVVTEYHDDSFVFVIKYSDTDKNTVNDKLDAVIKGFNNYLDIDNLEYEVIMAKDLRLVSLQNRPADLSKSYNLAGYITIGAIIGLVVAILGVVLIYSLDNTIKEREELESITGVSVLSYINKE